MKFNCQFRKIVILGLLAMLVFPVSGGFAIAAGVEVAVKPVPNLPLPIRALHFVLAPTEESASALDYMAAERIVVEAGRAGFNVAIIQLANGVNFDSAPKLTRRNAWSKEMLVKLASVARTHGVELIPEVKLLTHQDKLFQRHFPSLMYNAATYDARREETYGMVFSLLDEIINTLHPKAIHIGHDEVAGQNQKMKRLRSEETMLPADLFLQDVLKIHSYLQKKGIETWMWGDMLISPDEFPNMFRRHLHGIESGYGKSLRNKLPRDIVICDWHYADEQIDFPSLDMFKREGFRVLGSTWKKEKTMDNFSRYAAKHGGDGMVATTWFHVPRKEWDIVDRIIKVSGAAFLRDFPDAK